MLPLHAYSKAENNALADEVQAASPGAEWPAAIADYVALRDAVKACQATP